MDPPGGEVECVERMATAVAAGTVGEARVGSAGSWIEHSNGARAVQAGCCCLESFGERTNAETSDRIHSCTAKLRCKQTLAITLSGVCLRLINMERKTIALRGRSTKFLNWLAVAVLGTSLRATAKNHREEVSKMGARADGGISASNKQRKQKASLQHAL